MSMASVTAVHSVHLDSRLFTIGSHGRGCLLRSQSMLASRLLRSSGIAKPPIKTRSLVTGAG